MQPYNNIAATPLNSPSSREVYDKVYDFGTFRFKVLQAAIHYTLPELRAMTREAEAELYGANTLDGIDADWWQKWIAILKGGIELRVRMQDGTCPAGYSVKIAKGNEGRITLEFIERVKERSDLVTLAQAKTDLRKVGARALRGLCPFHTEDTPSFHVWTDNPHWYCFGCERRGSVVDFVMLAEHMDFITALRFLAEKAGIEWPERPVKKIHRTVVTL